MNRQPCHTIWPGPPRSTTASLSSPWTSRSGLRLRSSSGSSPAHRADSQPRCRRCRPTGCTEGDVDGGHPGRCGRPDASSERGARRRRVRDGAVRCVTAAGRRGPRLRWRSLSGNLIDRRGAALALPILLAVALNVAAVAGLADIAGFHAVYASLIRIQWPWLCAVVAALAMSAIGYYFAYRSDLRRRGRLSAEPPPAHRHGGGGVRRFVLHRRNQAGQAGSPGQRR